VEKPGVYKFTSGARVEEVLIVAGGISGDADRERMGKALNRAAKVTDGQKIHIPRVGESADVAGVEDFDGCQGETTDEGSGPNYLININTARPKELESMWGIGPVTAQNITEQRPYSSVEELLTKKIIKSNVYEKNKDKLTVY
jgi:competence protein ComEA